MDRLTGPASIAVRDMVFAYAGRKVGAADCSLLAQMVGGVVVKGLDGAAAAGRLRAAGYDGLILIDPATYDRDEPLPETLFGGFGGWAGIQADHGVAVYLSPSSFVPKGDEAALASVIEAGIQFAAEVRSIGPLALIFTVLALERSWLTRDRRSLVRALSGMDQPVALLPAGRNDPLDSMVAVEGLVEVLQSSRTHETALLRSDLATLGAMAHGATMGAIGTHASVRHTVPPSKSAGGSPNDRTPGVLVRPLLRYIKGSRLGQLEGDRQLLDCPCEVCEGRPLSRFQDQRLEREAQFHSLVAWRGIAESVLSVDPAVRPRAWAMMCDQALERHDELIDRRGVILDTPQSLVAWSRLGG